jgi:hypothetical protein
MLGTTVSPSLPYLRGGPAVSGHRVVVRTLLSYFLLVADPLIWRA